MDTVSWISKTTGLLFFSCGDGVEERQTTGDLGEVGQVGVGNVVDLREEVVPELEEQRAGDIERILVRI